MLYALSFGNSITYNMCIAPLCITLSFILIRLLITFHPIVDMHSACIIQFRIRTSLDFITFTTLTFETPSLTPPSSCGTY